MDYPAGSAMQPAQHTCHPTARAEHDVHSGPFCILFGRGIALSGTRHRGQAAGAALRPLRRAIGPRQQPTLTFHRSVQQGRCSKGGRLRSQASGSRRWQAAAGGGGGNGAAMPQGVRLASYLICPAVRPSARSIGSLSLRRKRQQCGVAVWWPNAPANAREMTLRLAICESKACMPVRPGEPAERPLAWDATERQTCLCPYPRPVALNIAIVALQAQASHQAASGRTVLAPQPVGSSTTGRIGLKHSKKQQQA